MKDYVWCPECKHDEPYLSVSGKMSKGLYIPISRCRKING